MILITIMIFLKEKILLKKILDSSILKINDLKKAS